MVYWPECMGRGGSVFRITSSVCSKGVDRGGSMKPVAELKIILFRWVRENLRVTILKNMSNFAVEKIKSGSLSYLNITVCTESGRCEGDDGKRNQRVPKPGGEI